jgi:hypothetical protein
MRNVYFSFHYADIWKVNQIRNSGVVFGAKSAGFSDGSLWEEAEAKHDSALRRLIAEGLEGTSVTAVLIGRETAGRRWVKYDIQRSLKQGNALVGIHIHQVRDPDRRVARRGRIPHALKVHDVPIHDWTNVQDFRRWVEDAWQVRNRKPTLLERLFK